MKTFFFLVIPKKPFEFLILAEKPEFRRPFFFEITCFRPEKPFEFMMWLKITFEFRQRPFLFFFEITKI